MKRGKKGYKVNSLVNRLEKVVLDRLKLFALLFLTVVVEAFVVVVVEARDEGYCASYYYDLTLYELREEEKREKGAGKRE